MLQRFSLNMTLLLFGSDILLTMVAAYLARLLRLTLPYGVQIGPVHLEFPWIIYPIIACIWAAVFLALPVYDPRRTYRAVDDLQITTTAIAFATLIFAGVAYFFFRELSRFLFLYFFVLDLVFLLGLRLFLRMYSRFRRPRWAQNKPRLLILGAGRVGKRLARVFQEYSWHGAEIVGFLDDDQSQAKSLDESTPYLGGLDQTVQIVEAQNIDEVIMALPLYAHNRLVDIVHQLQDKHVRVRVVPDLFDLSFIKTTVEEFDGIPLIGLRDPVMSPFQRLIKRAFDMIVGSLTALVTLPVALIIALIIKFDSPGPILFAQDRVGENGRVFKMFKFRSMVLDADQRRDEVVGRNEDGQIIYKRPDDPHITRIGQFIRRTSLDELPQLYNVIKGDMSLVGPRPEMPWLVELYEPWQYKRFSVPQGMTGWWQITGRGDKPMHLHVEEDIYYVQNYSLMLDIVILWKTLGAVVKRSGAF